MIQTLIYAGFGVLYSVNYIVQLLKNIAFPTGKDGANMPEMRRVAVENDAHVLFADEASFPQWGVLSYTRAKSGQQPAVKTSGKRKGYRVLGSDRLLHRTVFCMKGS